MDAVRGGGGDALELEGNEGPLRGTTCLRTLADFQELIAESSERRAFEEALTQAAAGQDEWRVAAFCQVCRGPSVLRCDWVSSDGTRPNYRERLICPGCRMNNRQRFMATLVRRLSGLHPSSLPVYLYEQVTPLYKWARRSVRDREVIGSEYLGYGVPAGSVVDGVRHEDALKLSFADDSLALIASADVYEHVPDIHLALGEAFRVLASGGWLAFSIPFNAQSDTTVQRASLCDGVVVDHLPKVFHGNPVSGQGSLVFYDHGWDIFDRCREAGFGDAYAVAYWSSLYGYLGEGFQMMFIAEKR